MADFKIYFTFFIISMLKKQTESSLIEFLDPDDPDSTISIAKIIHSNFEIWKKCDRICQDKFKHLALSYRTCNRALSFIIICLYDGGKLSPGAGADGPVPAEVAPAADDHHDDHDDHHEFHSQGYQEVHHEEDHHEEAAAPANPASGEDVPIITQHN